MTDTTTIQGVVTRGLKDCVALAALLLCACATPITPQMFTEELAHRAIVVHKDGFAVGRHNEALDEAAFAEQWSGIVRAAEETWSHVNGRISDGRRRLVLFVHGGVNNYQDSFERVASINQGQKNDAALAPYHFIFLNWDSNLLGSIGEDFFGIRGGERHEAAAVLTSPLSAARPLAESLLASPELVWHEMAHGFSAIDVTTDDNWPGCLLAFSRHKDVSDSWRFGSLALQVLGLPVRYGTSVVVKTLGTPAWDMMKRRAELAFSPDPQAEGGGRAQGDGGPLGAALLLGRHLKRRLDNEWRDVDLTLVGHSMGAMIVNNLLMAFPEMRVKRIVYLGAAASITSVRQAVLPFLDRNQSVGTEFWSFSLSETRELLEYHAFDLYNRGSLLVWIDELFERVDTPAARVFGRAENVRRYVARLVPAPMRRRLVKWDRGQADPKSHSDLAEVRFLAKSFSLMDGEEGVQCRVPVTDETRQRDHNALIR